MISQFQKHRYTRSLTEQQIDKAILQERELLKKKRKTLYPSNITKHFLK